MFLIRLKSDFFTHINLGAQDLFKRTTSTGTNIISGLDGLRAIAAILVLLHHSKLGPESAGATGVWIFFILSGFLLIQPFVRTQDAVSPGKIAAYITRRVFRVIPLYYVVAPFYAWLLWGADWNRLFLHFTFQRADWLFWTIKTELLFYLILPVIAVFLTVIKAKDSKVTFMVFVLIVAWLITEQHRLITITAGSADKPYMIFVTPFILGILIALVNVKLARVNAEVIFILSCVMLILMNVDVEWVKTIRNDWFGIIGEKIAWQQRWLVYPFCVLLVMAVSNGAGRFLERQPLKAIGVAGYGFYLWHSLVLNMLRRNDIVTEPLQLFIVTWAVTTSLAMVTYILIERPGIILGRKIARKIA